MFIKGQECTKNLATEAEQAANSGGGRASYTASQGNSLENSQGGSDAGKDKDRKRITIEDKSSCKDGQNTSERSLTGRTQRYGLVQHNP